MFKIFILFFIFNEVRSDCDTYIECFNDFFNNFFIKNNSTVIDNIQTDNLPENFDQIHDIQINELSKVITELQSFIESDVAHKIKSGTTFEKVNNNTKIYVQSFNYNGNFDKLINSPEKPLTEAPTKAKIKKTNNRLNEIPISEDFNSYYDILDDNSTDYPIIDYVELYKDTTNEELVYESPTTVSIRDEIQERIDEYTIEIDDSFDNDTNISSCHGKSPGIKQIFPWIATIFIKTDSGSNQFNYYCDGGLINENHIITAARCMQSVNSTVKPENVLVFLGKRSLQAVAENEKTVKVNKILIHENFTTSDGIFENDLAILTLEEPVPPSDVIRPACIDDGEENIEQTATTAWTPTGDLTPVYFIKRDTACNEKGYIICATYGNEVPLCPNYGGIYAVKRSKLWYLRGIRTGDPEDRGICFNKDVQYTDLENYQDWIISSINNK